MDHRSSCSRKTSNKSCRCRAGAVAALDRRRVRRIELVQGRLDGLAEVAEPFGERAGGAREAREPPLGGAHRLLLRVQRCWRSSSASAAVWWLAAAARAASSSVNSAATA